MTTTTKECRLIFETLGRETKGAMQSVLGSLNLLGDGELSPAQSSHVRHCLESVHRVIRDLEDVLMLNDVPLTQVDFVRFSPAERMRTIASVLTPLASERNISLEVDAPAGIPLVEADAGAFEQVVTRIVEYAIRSVQGHAIYLSIRCSDPELERGSTIQVVVHCAEWPLTEDHVTLHLAKAYASLMGTTLHYIRAESEGRIEISFPVNWVDPKLPRVAKPGIRILVADDCDESYDLLSAFLEDQPWSLSRASDGSEAVAMATSGQYDMALMDINMPHLNGYAATQRIREWETAQCRKRMPIIVVSSDGLESQIREGAIVGCSAYLEKPVPRTALVGTIKRYVARMTF